MSGRNEIDLEIDFTGAVLVKWTGRANHRRPAETLKPTFERLISMGRYIRFDFSELEHMSSMTMVVVLKFFKQLDSAGFGFDFRYDERVAWQRSTFKRLNAVMPAQPALLAA